MLRLLLTFLPGRADEFILQVSLCIRPVVIQLVEQHAPVVVIGRRELIGEICPDRDLVVETPHQRLARVRQGEDMVAGHIETAEEADRNDIHKNQDGANDGDPEKRLDLLGSRSHGGLPFPPLE